MSKVGGRGADGYIFAVELIDYVAVSCGACDRDTATRLKSGEVIRALLWVLVGIPSHLPLGFHYFMAIFEGGGEMRPETRSCKLHQSAAAACELFTCCRHDATHYFGITPPPPIWNSVN